MSNYSISVEPHKTHNPWLIAQAMGYVGLWAIRGQFRGFCGRQNLWAMLREYGLREICVIKASSVYSKY